MSPSPAARETWWVELDKTRVCVVLRVEADRAEVVYGQSSPGASPAVPVKLGSHDGKALHISKDTYFRDSNVRIVRLELFRSRLGRCPPSLFLKLERMVAEQAGTPYAAGQLHGFVPVALPLQDEPPSERSPC